MTVLRRSVFKRLDPDPEWYTNRKKRTIAVRGKTITLRLWQLEDGTYRVDVVGSTQPWARIFYEGDDMLVLDVPPGILQFYRVEKIFGHDHVSGSFQFEAKKEDFCGSSQTVS